MIAAMMRRAFITLLGGAALSKGMEKTMKVWRRQ
jgi:hypothetical protein